MINLLMEQILKIIPGNNLYVKCLYCKKLLYMNYGCKDCDPNRIIEGWTSGDSDIDKFIKDTMYNARNGGNGGKYLNWISHDKFVDISQLYEDDFEKVYLATWLKKESQPVKVTLKKFTESQNLTAERLDEVFWQSFLVLSRDYSMLPLIYLFQLQIKTHWNFNLNESFSSKFYGMTKDPKTQEFIMVTHYGNQGDLRNFIKNKYNSLKWENKIELLYNISKNLKDLHKSGYCHNNLYSGNIILDCHSKLDSKKETYTTYITNFRLTRKLDSITVPNDKVFGVLPYIAPHNVILGVLGQRPKISKMALCVGPFAVYCFVISYAL